MAYFISSIATKFENSDLKNKKSLYSTFLYKIHGFNKNKRIRPLLSLFEPPIRKIDLSSLTPKLRVLGQKTTGAITRLHVDLHGLC